MIHHLIFWMDYLILRIGRICDYAFPVKIGLINSTGNMSFWSKAYCYLLLLTGSKERNGNFLEGLCFKRQNELPT